MLTTLGQINKVLADNKAGKLPTPYSIRYPWADKPQMLLKISGKYIVYDFENNRIVSTLKLKDKAANEDYCVANGNVAYTVNNNLYVNEQAITDEPEGIVCGNPSTAMNSASTKVPSGARKATCSLSTAWTKAW